MATSTSDNSQEIMDTVQALSDRLDTLNGQMSQNFSAENAVQLRDIPQGPGSRLDADTVDGFQVTNFRAPGKNSLVTTGDNGVFPISVIPAIPPGTLNLTDAHIFVGGVTNKATDVAMSGDASIADTGALTLKTVNSNVGTFGSSNQVAQVTVNAKGLTTAASSISITNLSPAAVNLTSAHVLVGNGSNVAADVALSGDATISNTGALTLDTVNSNVGTFGDSTHVGTFTVNAKGLITAASNVAIGDVELTVVTVASDYPILTTDHYVLTNAMLTATLPTAVGVTGKSYTIKRINASGNATIATTGGQTIDGSSTQTLATQYAAISVFSDGSNWFIF